jgi:hypothetical protein
MRARNGVCEECGRQTTVVLGTCRPCDRAEMLARPRRPAKPPVILCSQCGEALDPVNPGGGLRYQCLPCGRSVP